MLSTMSDPEICVYPDSEKLGASAGFLRTDGARARLLNREAANLAVLRRGAQRVTRWATFDCYGTLIDWNAGIAGVLEQLFGAERTPDLLARYHRLEPEVQAETYRSYAEVLTLTLERLASETGLSIPEGESGALVHSLPDWPPFREVPQALEELRASRLEPRHPLQHRSRADRQSPRSRWRTDRPRRHRRGRRLLQARARTLGPLLRADDRRPRAPRARRGQSLPRRRSGA